MSFSFINPPFLSLAFARTNRERAPREDEEVKEEVKKEKEEEERGKGTNRSEKIRV